MSTEKQTQFSVLKFSQCWTDLVNFSFNPLWFEWRYTRNLLADFKLSYKLTLSVIKWELWQLPEFKLRWSHDRRRQSYSFCGQILKSLHAIRQQLTRFVNTQCGCCGWLSVTTSTNFNSVSAKFTEKEPFLCRCRATQS